MWKRKLSVMLALAMILGSVPAEHVQAMSPLTVQEEKSVEKTEDAMMSELFSEIEKAGDDIDETSAETPSDTEITGETEHSMDIETVPSTEETENSDGLDETDALETVEESKTDDLTEQTISQEQLLAEDSLEEDAKLLLEKLREKYEDLIWLEGSVYAFTDEFGWKQQVDLYDPETYQRFMEETEAEPYVVNDSHISVLSTGTSTYSPFTHSYYQQESHKANYIVQHGIDVSSYQGNIDWNAAKNAGVTFAFVRVGYRGYGQAGTLNYDAYAAQNIRGAYASGIKVGVYFFSQAINDRESREEARKCMDYIESNGLKSMVTLPVVMDYEFAGGSQGRLTKAGLSADQHQSICNAFGNEVNERGGYKTMIYANYTMLTKHMRPENTPDYIGYWIARYNVRTEYSGDYQYWQYSSKGSVSGINGNVDCNFYYAKEEIKKITGSDIVISWDSEIDYLEGVDGVKNSLHIYDTSQKRMLSQGTDYTATVTSTGTDTYQAVITGIGKYTGTVTKTVKATTMTLHASMIASIPDQIYTGNPITLETGVPIVVTHAGKVLVKDQDYTVSYENNTEVGKASVVITGMGKYVGTAKKSFKIVGIPIQKEWLQPIPDQIYTGTAFTTQTGLAVVLTNDLGKVLQENTDYVISYKNNIKCGKATITITGKGNYTGKITTTFAIGKDTLGEGTTTLPDNMTVRVGKMPGTYIAGYTGKAIKPSVEVFLNGKELSKSYYTVSYSNNVNIGTEAMITIKGKGQYVGSSKVAFSIAKFGLLTKISSDMVTVEDSFYLNNGQQWKPDAIVVCKGKRLVAGQDYTITYRNSKKVAVDSLTGKGTYYVDIEGINAFTGKVTKKVSVKDSGKNWISHDTIQVSVADTETGGIIYTGKALKPQLQVISKQDPSVVLTEKQDYTVKYVNNTNAGTAKYVITGKGNYTGSYTGSFTISPRAVTDLTGTAEEPVASGDLTVSLKKYSVVFNGKRQVPVIVAKYGKTGLKLNKDYLVSYSDAGLQKAGKYTVKLTFQGNLSGSVELPFEIKQADLSKVSISIPKQYYQGKEIALTPDDVTVKLGSVTLSTEMKQGLRFTSWENNCEVSAKGVKASAVCVADAGSNFMQGTEKKISFSIVKKQMKDAQLVYTIGGKPVIDWKGTYETVYTGEPQNAQTGAVVSIVDSADQRTLIEGTDYKVSYSNNVNGGLAKVTVKGLGNYTGSVGLTFRIVGIPFSENGVLKDGYTMRLLQSSKEVTDTTYYYSGSSKKPSVELKYNGKKISSSHYSVTYSNNVDAGTATVTVTGKGNYTGTVTKTFQINRKTKSKSGSISISSIGVQKRTGTTIVPNLTVQVDGRQLVSGKDYTVSVVNSTRTIGKYGIGTAIITGVGNYEGLLGKKAFFIS